MYSSFFKIKIESLVFKTVVLLLLLLFQNGKSIGQSWINTYDVSDEGREIIQTQDGGYAILAEDGFDAMVMKTNSEGELEWSQFLIAPADSIDFYAGISIVQNTQGDIFISGYYKLVGVDEGGQFIAKFSIQGNQEWVRHYLFFDGGSVVGLTTTHGGASDLINLSNGNLLMAGQNSLHGNNTITFLKIEPQQGNSLDTLYINDNNYEVYVKDIVELDNGKFLVGGKRKEHSVAVIYGEAVIFYLNADGNLENTFIVPSTVGSNVLYPTVHDLISVSDGNFAGLMTLGSTFANETKVFKFSLADGFLWEKNITYVDSIFQQPVTYGLSIVETSDGEFNVLGYPRRIVKLDANGNQLSANQVMDFGTINSMILNNQDEIVISGRYTTIQSFVAKLDSNCQIFNKQVQGNIFIDENFSCQFDSLEQNLNDWLVTADNGNITFYATTDSLGNYSFDLFEDTFDIAVQIPSPIWQTCLNPQIATLDSLTDTVFLDFPIQILTYCPLMTVDISAPFLRRCFDNKYFVEYSNAGSEIALDAYIEITLDENMNVNSTSIPYVNQGDSLLVFDVGDVEVNDGGTFWIDFYLACGDSTILGQTHCSEAHIYPDSICYAVDPAWDMSSIEVDGTCETDSIRFFIKNVGTGNMTQQQDYYIVIDEVIMIQGNFQLNSGEVQEVAVEAMASTFRLEAEQSLGHPGNNMPSAIVEGCPDFGLLGLFAAFALNDEDNFIDIDCQQNVGSFDPNDKQAFPRGYGDEHQILPETKIEYKIRFQNTGTDTAFTVVVRDTLSEDLDIASFRMGVSSHQYDWEINGEHILKVTFDNIMLPDSNINELASHGFFKYNIRPKATTPLGTVIENRAGIYFDFNKPILTNTVFHTVDTGFVELNPLWTSIEELENENSTAIKVFPNPFSTATTFFFGENNFQKIELEIFDVMGKKVKRVNGNGEALIFRSENLTAGIYFFKVYGDDKLLGKGKLVLTH